MEAQQAHISQEFKDKNVEHVFNSFRAESKAKLLFIRELIFQIAAKMDEVGEIEEVLKWDNPSYLTRNPKSGTTIRLSEVRDNIGQYAISVHCQTRLISDFKAMYPKLNYDGTRSIIIDINNDLPLETLQHFVSMALCYHNH